MELEGAAAAAQARAAQAPASSFAGLAAAGLLAERLADQLTLLGGSGGGAGAAAARVRPSHRCVQCCPGDPGGGAHTRAAAMDCLMLCLAALACACLSAHGTSHTRDGFYQTHTHTSVLKGFSLSCFHAHCSASA